MTEQPIHRAISRAERITWPEARPLPPYSRVLQERLRRPETWRRFFGTSLDGSHLTLWVVTGSGAWEWAQQHLDTHLFVILPPDGIPGCYRWDFLAGHPPVLLLIVGEIEPRIVDDLATALLRGGVERVLLCDSSGLRYLPVVRVAT